MDEITTRLIDVLLGRRLFDRSQRPELERTGLSQTGGGTHLECRVRRSAPGDRRCSVCDVTRFVVDCETLLRIAAGEIEVAAEHQLVAPALVRSQALAALYESARRREISATEGLERVTRINSLKVRFLGDKVLQRTAWRVAEQLGWETTYDAEFVALTQLQADVFVTSDADLARAVLALSSDPTLRARGSGSPARTTQRAR